uniref:Uncharacterized protein n=1 Tax=Spongospora subterranea TaxID=70186 RepID=A0A0H5QT81_9EUKA|eukprot:CRZ04917.1 hypothetical protein [Spongospora subterranea]
MLIDSMESERPVGSRNPASEYGADHAMELGISEMNSNFPDIGLDTDEATQLAINRMIDKAVEKGFPSEWQNRLREIISRYRNVFRLKLSNDAPAAVTPLKS